MANMPDDKWVDDQLDALGGPEAPQADLEYARAQLHERARTSARRRRTVWAASLTAVVALVVLPWPRAIAQQIWDRLFLDRVDVVQDVPEGLSEDLLASLVFMPGTDFVEPQAVRDAAEASRLAGFQPLVPSSGVLKGTPQLAVLRTITLATKPVHTADLERALAAVGAWDVTVPREWEGITLTAEGGPVIVAQYEDAEVMQTTSFRMSTPPGFDFAHFMEVTFRIFGRGAEEARRLASTFDANPALLLHFPEQAPVHDIGLASGYGIFVGDPNAGDGICFFWHTADRLFIASADTMSFETAAALANSVNAVNTQ